MGTSISQEDQIIAAQAKEIAALKQRLESTTQQLNAALKNAHVIRCAREWRNADERRKECRKRCKEFENKQEGRPYSFYATEAMAYRQAAAKAGMTRRRLYEAVDAMDREGTH